MKEVEELIPNQLNPEAKEHKKTHTTEHVKVIEQFSTMMNNYQEL